MRYMGANHYRQRALIAVLLAAALVISTDSLSQGPADAIAFKGFPLGGTLADFRERFPDFLCRDRDSCVYQMDTCLRGNHGPEIMVNCLGRNSYGTVNPTSILATFKADTLRSVTIEYAPANFELLADALKERFGQPTSGSNEALQTGAGAQVTNTIYVWLKPEGALRISRYVGRVDRGTVVITERSAIEDFRRSQEDRRERAPKDL